MKKKSAATGVASAAVSSKPARKAKASVATAASKAESAPAKSKGRVSRVVASASSSAKAVTKRVKAVLSRAKPKAPAPKRESALLVVRHDVGWGSALFLRGSGAGLSWERGAALVCIGANEWVWSAEIDSPVVFKILRNDKEWSTGDNLVIAPGESLTVTPNFA